MKVVGIAGSLRPKSNTLEYVKTTLGVFDQAGIDTDLISLRNKKIEPCNGCYDCAKKGYCTIRDDDFDSILDHMRTAEGIILGSPVYLSSVVPPDDGVVIPGHVRGVLERQVLFRQSGGAHYGCQAGRPQHGLFATAPLVFYQRRHCARFHVLERGRGRNGRGERRGSGRRRAVHSHPFRRQHDIGHA